MNISIRFKLFIYMIGGIAVFACLLFLSNTFFIKEVYINKKKQHLIRNTEMVGIRIAGRKSYKDFQDQNLIYSLHNLEKSLGMAIYIGKPEGTIFYPPAPGTFTPSEVDSEGNGMMIISKNNGEMPPAPPHDGRIRWIAGTNDSLFAIMKDPFIRIETLRYQVRMKNGLILLVWVPMTEISESASISNGFTGIIALIMLAVTGVLALFIAGRFTRPITMLNQITRKMAMLDFSESLDIKRKDEIGQLSDSINRLSDKLDSSIRELNRRNRQLKQDILNERKLDKMRREFVSSVSHELKTPVFLIQGYADGLKSNVAASKKKRDYYCSVIMEEANKMASIIKDLLDLSQIESGMFTVRRSDFDISKFLRNAVLKYKDLLDEKSIRIEIHSDDGLMVSADPFRTEQVIQNYLNNAIDHLDTRKLIRISADDLPNKVRVSVFNSGKPVPKDSLDKIWLSFFKAGDSGKVRHNGSGLGLSIVKAIQERHGNRYGVINRKDGVEFWFDLDKTSLTYSKRMSIN